MSAESQATSQGGDDAGPVTSPYELTLAALTYSWRRQAGFNVAVGLCFALAGGPLLAVVWTSGLCLTDWSLQVIYRRLSVFAARVKSGRGLTWLSWLVFAKGAAWYGLPAAFTILDHSLAGLAFVGVEAVGLTALSVSTARNSQRVFASMVLVPVIVLPACIIVTLGLAQGAAALCEMFVLAFALWLIGAGTSKVVADWNQANALRLRAMCDMKAALARSETAESNLSEALAKAEAASRAKSEFLATMGHEIRTPLNGVLGMAQAMDRGELSFDQRERLRVISGAGQSLLTLLNDLLDLSKIEAGKVELEERLVDVEALADGAGAFLPLLQEKDVSFAVAVDPQASRYWRGDAGRIRQVLHNLISNAVKFTDRGSVTVRMSERDGALVIAVEDTGIGIAHDRLAQVFEPFVQADASTTRRYGGSGLGLAICRDLVGLMGGAITLDSAEGAGSTFTVTLPLRPAAAPDATPESDAPEALSCRGLRVLAAEDNPMNQIVLRTLLEASGIELTLASNGQEAFEAWSAGCWDIVLMDIQMPVMDGLTATRRIRTAERALGADRTPIIALTANAMDHHAVEYLSAGIDALVAKPIDLATLLATMAEVLESVPSFEGPALRRATA